MTPLETSVQNYLFVLGVSGYTESTIIGYRRILKRFLDWSLELGIDDEKLFTRRILIAYQHHIYRRLKTNGKRISFRTQARVVNAIKQYFKWLALEDMIEANPAADLVPPREPHRLPRDVLSVAEMEKVLAVPDTTTLHGLRDRTIMEVLYATGIRRGEVAGLDLRDIRFEEQRLFIRAGKGQKDRIVPISRRALDWIERYLEKRPPADDDALFLSTQGGRISLYYLTNRMGRYVKKSGVAKTGACHIFRHTLATMMLENGADIRFVQEMLGHKEISTTQIYTRVSIRKLQEIYNATNPGSKC